MSALDDVNRTLGGFHVPYVDDAAVATREYLLFGAAERHCGDFCLDAVVGAA
jgi:hypothetical protein